MNEKFVILFFKARTRVSQSVKYVQYMYTVLYCYVQYTV
jgi:hypothetical protein